MVGSSPNEKTPFFNVCPVLKTCENPLKPIDRKATTIISFFISIGFEI